jgi:hypothetical protein
MPHAWSDINTTALFRPRHGPIWGACDIQATVARQTGGVFARRDPRLAPPRRRQVKKI